MSSYYDWGYNSFLTRTIVTSPTQSPMTARNAIPIGALSVSQFAAPLNPTTTITFSSVDNNTAAWTEGVIYFANGSHSLKITAGNTGNIAATTYVYYDEDKSPVLQTTTNPANAAGSRRFLLAIVELGETGKDCKITPTIAAGLVVSNLTAEQIAAGTITANEISGDQLDVVAAKTGTLNVDEYITVGVSNIKIDGANKRIIVNDGTTNRIVIGNV